MIPQYYIKYITVRKCESPYKAPLSRAVALDKGVRLCYNHSNNGQFETILS